MKTFAVATLAIAATASAQLTHNDSTGVWSCAVPNGAYCVGDSLSSNIIVRCNAGVGTPGNCNNNLNGVPPVGVKTGALCYQSSATAADAACSLNGIAYPDNGEKFTIPVSGGYGTSSASSAPSSTPAGYETSTPSSTPAGYETSSVSLSTAVSSSSPVAYSTSSPAAPYPTTSANGTQPHHTLSTGYYHPTGTGAPSYTGSHTPTPTLFPGAANQAFASSSLAALLPIAGLFAFLF